MKQRIYKGSYFFSGTTRDSLKKYAAEREEKNAGF